MSDEQEERNDKETTDGDSFVLPLFGGKASRGAWVGFVCAAGIFGVCFEEGMELGLILIVPLYFVLSFLGHSIEKFVKKLYNKKKPFVFRSRAELVELLRTKLPRMGRNKVIIAIALVVIALGVVLWQSGSGDHLDLSSQRSLDRIISKAIDISKVNKGLAERADEWFLPGEVDGYSGWIKMVNDYRYIERLFQVKDGKKEGLDLFWNEYGELTSEDTYINGELISD